MAFQGNPTGFFDRAHSRESVNRSGELFTPHADPRPNSVTDACAPSLEVARRELGQSSVARLACPIVSLMPIDLASFAFGKGTGVSQDEYTKSLPHRSEAHTTRGREGGGGAVARPRAGRALHF